MQHYKPFKNVLIIHFSLVFTLTKLSTDTRVENNGHKGEQKNHKYIKIPHCRCQKIPKKSPILTSSVTYMPTHEFHVLLLVQQHRELEEDQGGDDVTA